MSRISEKTDVSRREKSAGSIVVVVTLRLSLLSLFSSLFAVPLNIVSHPPERKKIERKISIALQGRITSPLDVKIRHDRRSP